MTTVNNQLSNNTYKSCHIILILKVMIANKHVPKRVAAGVIQDRELNQRKLEPPDPIVQSLGLSL